MLSLWDVVMIAMLVGLSAAYAVEKIIEKVKGGKHERE